MLAFQEFNLDESDSGLKSQEEADADLAIEIEMLRVRADKMTDAERYVKGLELPPSTVKDVYENNRGESIAVCEGFTISNRYVFNTVDL